MKVSLKIDNSLVEKYNQQYKTSYYSLPDNATSLEKSEVVIKKGNTASEASLFRLCAKGKNTAVGCHFLLQCMKMKSESEVAQSCLTLGDPMDCSLPGSSIHGIFQARVLEWGASSQVRVAMRWKQAPV